MSIAKPILPSTVIRFTGTSAPRIAPAAADTVAIPIIADWGPIGSDPPGANKLMGGPQECTSFSDYTTLFGDSDTPGRTAVAGAFAGPNLPGAVGAGAVIVYRMGDGTQAAATITIKAVSAGANTLSLTAKYKGSRGNRISFIVDSNPSNAAQDRIRIFFDGVLQETYLYSAPALAAVTALINLKSKLVTAVALVLDTGPALRLTQNPGGTAIVLAGGIDGTTSITSVQHLAALAGLEYQSFGILAPYDLTDTTIKAAYNSWQQTMESNSRPVRVVLGGAAGESTATALSEAATLADEHVIRFGVGTYHDDLLGKDLSTSQLASRIAGILASKGDSHAITGQKIGGLHVLAGPSDDELPLCVQGGVTCLSPVSSPDADVHILKGVSTYTLDSVAKPLDVFGDPRLIGVMDDYVRNMTEFGMDNVIGDLPVNDDSRATVRGEAKRLQDDLQTRGLILPADPNANPPVPAPWVIVEDPEDPSLADAIPYSFGWKFARTANAIMGEGSIL